MSTVSADRWERWTPDEMLRELQDFETLASHYFNIELARADSWRALTGSFLDLISAFRKETPEDGTDWTQRAQDALGVFDIAAKANKVADHKDFPTLAAHFRLFLGSAGLVQNKPSISTDQATNKIFELLIALVAMQFASDVEVEDPNYAEGTNPDVLVRYKGHLIGLACKCPHSRVGKTLADNVRKGVSQIESSPAVGGFVMLNLKNLWQNDHVWEHQGGKTYSSWAYVEEADQAIEKYVKVTTDALEPEFVAEDPFGGKKAYPMVLYYLAPSLLIELRDGPALTTMRRLVPRQFTGQPLPEVASDVLELLDRSVQRPFSGDRGVYSISNRVR